MVFCKIESNEQKQATSWWKNYEKSVHIFIIKDQVASFFETQCTMFCQTVGAV